MQPGGDKRVGVVWHTKAPARACDDLPDRHPAPLARLNPTIVVQVDRTDLDNQLYDNFVAAQELVGTVHRADDVDDLRDACRRRAARSSARPSRSSACKDRRAPPSAAFRRRNILVIADEAHRTQYNLVDGFGYHLRQALPNASFIAFTGHADRQRRRQHGPALRRHIHIYDMQQAKDDNAVVPIYYEARHIPLRLANRDRRRAGGDRRGEELRRTATAGAGQGQMGGHRAGRRGQRACGHPGPGFVSPLHSPSGRSAARRWSSA